MSSKYALVVVVIMAALLLSGFGRDQAQADTDLVTGIQYNPDPVVAGEDVEFSCTLTDETNVDKVFLNMCTDMFCFPPVEMEKGTDGVWRGTSSAVTDLVSHHFNITVEFTDTSKVWTDDEYFDPVEKSNGNGGNGNDDDDDGIIPALGAVAVLAVFAALAVTARGKKGKA